MFRPLSLIIMLLFCTGQVQASGGYDEAWVMVDTQRQALTVMKGGQVQQVFTGIALGYGGAAELRFQGDGQTPKGVFQIGWINPQSKFHLFFGLDYPNLDQAKQAYQSARIDYQTYQEISAAVSQGQTPPQDTALGGYIGIHGLGSKDPGVHKTLNWTEGCVALTNEQVDQLASWVGVGTRVVII